MKREDAEKIYDLGKDAVVDLILQLVDRIEKLEAQLKKDSHNSSKPPSSDGLRKKPKTRSSRRQTGKKTGGQEGHKGKTLEMSESPDKIIRLSSNKCACCGKSLKGCASKGIDRRQVFEIPEIELEVTEYQSEINDCPHCGHENKGEFPENVTKRTQYGNYLHSLAVYFRNYELIPTERTSEIFEDIFGVRLSEGTIVNSTKRCAAKLSGFKNWAKEQILDSEVAYFDETGININGKLHWMHNASTPFVTSYNVHKKRGGEAFNEIGILPEYRGKAMHDHWVPYLRYECEHLLCNAHHIRELIFAFEEEKQPWAKKMIELLCEAKKHKEEAAAKGENLKSETIKLYETRYKRILAQGFRNNPPPVPDVDLKRGRKKKGKILSLLERLRDYQTETLAFMYGADIPFDNNLAERDIRMVKVQQKISGLFRSFSGAEEFCLIRSFLSTARKQGYNIIDAIHAILKGEDIYLNFSVKIAE
ncbi:MAG TPA: IS66 family transposase [Spirochaetota bacterium]|nr:IS66 family transposase [Spirochaetota bacterium]